MQVAVTVWENRISPLFDATHRLLIADIQGRHIVARHFEPFYCESALSRAARLDDLGIQVLICGGISDFSESLLEARGIRVHAFVSGTVEEVLTTYLADKLDGETD